MAYYLVVVFLRYRIDIMAWATLKINPVPAPEYEPVLTGQQDPGNNHQSEVKDHYAYSMGVSSKSKPNEQGRDDSGKAGSQNAVHELTHDLHIVFEDASAKKSRKQDLLMQIRKTLQDHIQLKGTSLEGEIIQHVATQAKECCSVHIYTDELNNLWNP